MQVNRICGERDLPVATGSLFESTAAHTGDAAVEACLRYFFSLPIKLDHLLAIKAAHERMAVGKALDGRRLLGCGFPNDLAVGVVFGDAVIVVLRHQDAAV